MDSMGNPTQPLQYAGTIPLARARHRRFALGLTSCIVALVSYGIHALQFWPVNPAPEALLLSGWMLSLFGIILAVIGIWDKRERHPLDFLGLFMNVLSFAVPAWLLH